MMLEKQVVIRDADSNDIAFITQLMCEMGYHTNIAEMHKRLQEIWQESSNRTFVVTIENKVIGMAGVTVNLSYERDGKYIRVIAFVIDSSFRKKGVGRKLIKFVEDWGMEIGASSVLLNCGNREERTEAHSFYKNLGYREKSTGYIKLLKNSEK